MSHTLTELSLEDHIRALRKGLAEADIIVTTGGTSMGASDLLKPVIERHLGGTVHFGRVQIKPGKPTTFATAPVPASKKGQGDTPGKRGEGEGEDETTEERAKRRERTQPGTRARSGTCSVSNQRSNSASAAREESSHSTTQMYRQSSSTSVSSDGVGVPGLGKGERCGSGGKSLHEWSARGKRVSRANSVRGETP